MDQESVSRLEILGNILEFYKVQPGMNKDGKLEKVEEYLLLMHALYSESSKELDELDINDIDFLENLFDTFNGYLNAVGEEMDKIFDENIIDLTLIPIFGFSIVLPIHSIEMIKAWNKTEQDYWRIEYELSKLEELVESDLFFEHFSYLIKKLMLKINAKLVVAIEDLI
ncbi:hypothetical protein [Ancylomarina sp.]|uniref:hypothetical protein n=1 Tax=Ancylomarina sp. TaxID=1970196 RepID=UPI0035676F52